MDNNPELPAWRHRVALAHRIARTLAAGRVMLWESPAGRLRLYDPPGQVIYDNQGQPLYRIIGCP